MVDTGALSCMLLTSVVAFQNVAPTTPEDQQSKLCNQQQQGKKAPQILGFL